MNPLPSFDDQDRLAQAMAPILASAAWGQRVLVVALRFGADVWWVTQAERYGLDISVLPLELPMALWPLDWLARLRLAEAQWRALYYDLVVLHGARDALRAGQVDPEMLLASCRIIARHTQLFLT